jgi:hypothetical protein
LYPVVYESPRNAATRRVVGAVARTGLPEGELHSRAGRTTAIGLGGAATSEATGIAPGDAEATVETEATAVVTSIAWKPAVDVAAGTRTAAMAPMETVPSTAMLARATTIAPLQK